MRAYRINCGACENSELDEQPKEHCESQTTVSGLQSQLGHEDNWNNSPQIHFWTNCTRRGTRGFLSLINDIFPKKLWVWHSFKEAFNDRDEIGTLRLSVLIGNVHYFTVHGSSIRDQEKQNKKLRDETVLAKQWIRTDSMEPNKNYMRKKWTWRARLKLIVRY